MPSSPDVDFGHHEPEETSSWQVSTHGWFARTGQLRMARMHLAIGI